VDDPARTRGIERRGDLPEERKRAGRLHLSAGEQILERRPSGWRRRAASRAAIAVLAPVRQDAPHRQMMPDQHRRMEDCRIGPTVRWDIGSWRAIPAIKRLSRAE